MCGATLGRGVRLGAEAADAGRCRLLGDPVELGWAALRSVASGCLGLHPFSLTAMMDGVWMFSARFWAVADFPTPWRCRRCRRCLGGFADEAARNATAERWIMIYSDAFLFPRRVTFDFGLWVGGTAAGRQPKWWRRCAAGPAPGGQRMMQSASIPDHSARREADQVVRQREGAKRPPWGSAEAASYIKPTGQPTRPRRAGRRPARINCAPAGETARQQDACGHAEASETSATWGARPRGRRRAADDHPAPRSAGSPPAARVPSAAVGAVGSWPATPPSRP